MGFHKYLRAAKVMDNSPDYTRNPSDGFPSQHNLHDLTIHSPIYHTNNHGQPFLVVLCKYEAQTTMNKIVMAPIGSEHKGADPI
jgi:hypothetical protein